MPCLPSTAPHLSPGRPSLTNLQAQAGETVVLSVNEAQAALRRAHGADGVPDNLALVLGCGGCPRWAACPCGRLRWHVLGTAPFLQTESGLALTVSCVLRSAPRSELAEDDLNFLEPRGQGPGGEQYVMHIPRVLTLARLHHWPR